jgi:hypothetical protein
LPYGEPLNDARTPLADFFRILFEVKYPTSSSGLLQEATASQPSLREETRAI